MLPSPLVAGRPFYPTLDGAPENLVGFLTHGIEDENNNVIAVASTTGIVESSPGSYVATRTVPMVPGSYLSVWYDLDTNTSATEVFEVVLKSYIELGLYYTSPDEVRKWLGVTEADMPDEMLTRPIKMAQLDVDIACGGWVAYEDTGLKFASAIPSYSVLNEREAAFLNTATCAQVEYRMLMGDDFMTKDQYQQESGPDYTTTGKLRKVGSMVYSQLHQAGLLRLAQGRMGHKAWSPLDRYGVLPRA